MNKETFISNCIYNCFQTEPKNASLLRFATHIDLPKRCVLLELNRRNVRILEKDAAADSLRLDIFTDFVKHVISAHRLNLNFRFILNTGDEDHPCGFTSFQFSRNCSNPSYILVPDPHLLSRYLGRTIVDPVPFQKKYPTYIFRGSDTGAYPNASKNQRIAICDLFNKQPDCDFKISNFITFNKNLLHYFNYPMDKISGEYMTIDEQALHAYIVDIDGNTIAWDRNCWALLLNSILVKLRWAGSEQFETWYSAYMYSNDIVPVFETNKPWPPVIEKEEDVIRKQQEFSRLLLSKEVNSEYLKRVLVLYDKHYNAPPL